MGEPTNFGNVQVSAAGLRYVSDFEAETTIRGIWSANHKRILGWIAGIAAAIFAAWFVRTYFQR